jgi:2-polyprenyl-6-methoxyphenol hydroxylase-like FAD-dependent oxidoreductase
MDIAEIKFWKMKNVVVDKWYMDRVFIIGDASHQYPPSGGYGLNTGVSDAFALAWRLKYILQSDNRQLENLLKESFENERIVHSTVFKLFTSLVYISMC